MPTYSFVMTQTIYQEAQADIEAATFQEAMAELARRSDARELGWGTGPDGDGTTSIVRAISKEGERLAGDPLKGNPGWWGLNGHFDLDDVPDELRTLEA